MKQGYLHFINQHVNVGKSYLNRPPEEGYLPIYKA